MARPNRRQWVRLYRDERGTFAQLPLLARALAAEMLKLTNDEGAIPLGGKEPPDAVAFALGADRSDRRALKKYLPMLESDGYYVRDEQADCLWVQSFGRFQSTEPMDEPSPAPADDEQPDPEPPRPSHDEVTTEPRSGHDDDTTESRPCNDAATTEPRQCHEDGANPPESLPRAREGARAQGVEESRVEKRSNARAVSGSEQTGPPEPPLDQWLVDQFEAAWRYYNPGAAPPHPYKLNPMAGWVGNTVQAIRAQSRVDGKPEKHNAQRLLKWWFEHHFWGEEHPENVDKLGEKAAGAFAEMARRAA